MKIVHVVYSLELGGAEVLVAQLCRMQRANGHDVSVCAYSTLGVVGQELAAEGFAIYVPGEAPPALTMLRYFRHFRRLRPDVVHCHNPAPTLQAAMAARLAGTRSVIATRHSLVAPPYDTAAELKFSLLSYFCDWIVGICEATCTNLRGAPLARGKRTVRVYNGAAPIELEGTEQLEKRGFTLVFLGRLAAVKDLGTLIRAVALAREQVGDLELWIVGDGSVRGELEALSGELGVAEAVRFWGRQMQTARFYAAADVFAMSSTSEGLPMSLLQAMSVGVPALVTDVGGMAEVVRLAKCGLMAPVGDWRGMAEQIVLLASDTSLRAQLGECGRRAYEAEFTLERMDAEYSKLYQRSG